MPTVKMPRVDRSRESSLEPEQQSDTGWRLLRIRDLRWLWIGQAISQIGEGLNKVALLYLVFNLTNSTLKMTMIGVLETLPPLILGPLLGVYVDRFPKKWNHDGRRWTASRVGAYYPTSLHPRRTDVAACLCRRLCDGHGGDRVWAGALGHRASHR